MSACLTNIDSFWSCLTVSACSEEYMRPFFVATSCISTCSITPPPDSVLHQLVLFSGGVFYSQTPASSRIVRTQSDLGLLPADGPVDRVEDGLPPGRAGARLPRRSAIATDRIVLCRSTSRHVSWYKGMLSCGMLCYIVPWSVVEWYGVLWCQMVCCVMSNIACRIR